MKRPNITGNFKIANRHLVVLSFVACLSLSCSGEKAGGYVNITEFAKMERDDQGVVLHWEEPRDIYKVVVKTDAPSKLAERKLQYWQNHWPRQRVPKGEVVGGGSGWTAIDDWFNGQWQDADARVEVKSDQLVYTFNPINTLEFSEEEFDADYRRSGKIRVPVEKGDPEIQAIEVFTNSFWKKQLVKLEWGDGFSVKPFQGHFEVYNGTLEDIEALSDNVFIEDKGRCSFQCDGKGGIMKLGFRYTVNTDDIRSSDRTIITLRSGVKSFSFLAKDIASGEKIYIRDYDMLISALNDKVDYAEFKKGWETDLTKTLYD